MGSKEEGGGKQAGGGHGREEGEGGGRGEKGGTEQPLRTHSCPPHQRLRVCCVSAELLPGSFWSLPPSWQLLGAHPARSRTTA